MRVKISTNPPLPVIRAWFPIAPPSAHTHAPTQTISAFKSLLCTSLPALLDVSPSSLRLSIDDFELLDSTELTVVRDGDLVCVDALDTLPVENATARVLAVDQRASRILQTNSEPEMSRKRKRRTPTPSSSDSESDSEATSTSESESEEETTSESGTTSDSSDPSRQTTSSLHKAEAAKIHAEARLEVTASAQSKPRVVPPFTLVPPGYGKPQTRSRNLRRRLKRIHEREAGAQSGPVSGANAIASGEKTAMPRMTDAREEVQGTTGLMSLSLRNKNKAKNFKSLMNRPLPPKITFGDEERDGSVSASGAMATPECPTPPIGSTQSLTRGVPQLIPPSLRPSLPPNLFVTSIDVEAGLHKNKKKRKMRVEYGDELEAEEITLDYGDAAETEGPPGTDVDIEGLETMAEKRWDALEKPTREKPATPGTIVGCKALGINPATYTPEQLLTLGRVVRCGSDSVVVRPLRAREAVSFGGPVDDSAEPADEGHTWEDIEGGDWRIVG